ncbi:MAG: MurR/RpiR family transcriptional regulator [Deltaproteobacteria bacterium]|nr:MAG: MurR/RpiR family transcriptional regulator [Deltaproteobacteria bacterium]
MTSRLRAREHLRDVNKYCTIVAMRTTFIAQRPRADGREPDASAAKRAAHRREQGNNLLERWQAARDKLPDGRRRLVDGILEHLDETVFLTSPELAARFDTDPATVVRTVQALGYAGFADFARDLRSYFLSKVNPYRVMVAEAEDHKGAAHHVRASVQRDLQNVQRVHDGLDPAALAELGERLSRCRHVIVVAGDLDHPIAQFLAYSLSGIGISATAPTGEGLTLCQLRAVTREDACLGIGFRRCLRVPVEAVRTARGRGAFTLAITDADSTPLARQAERSLLAPIDAESFAGSYVGTLAAINALLVSCAHANPERTLALLKPTEAEYRDGLRWYREPAQRRTDRANGGAVQKGDGQRGSRASARARRGRKDNE